MSGKMKKLLGIIVLGLLLSGNAYAEILNFECKQPKNKSLKYINYEIDFDLVGLDHEKTFRDHSSEFVDINLISGG